MHFSFAECKLLCFTVIYMNKSMTSVGLGCSVCEAPALQAGFDPHLGLIHVHSFSSPVIHEHQHVRIIFRKTVKFIQILF